MREDGEQIGRVRAVTEMVARRMFYHYKAQKALKAQIALSAISPASGVFQQVVGTYLRAYLKTVGEYDVYLDRLYDGQLRPDISIERRGKRLAAIEVKTDLGWHREYISSGGWRSRKDKCLGAGFPYSYLLILSNLNWPGFPPSMESEGVRVLLSGHPNDRRFKWYTNDRIPLDGPSTPPSPSDDVIHPIEELFEQLHAIPDPS